MNRRRLTIATSDSMSGGWRSGRRLAPEREVAELPVAERLGWFGGGKMLVVWEWRQSVLRCW